MSGSGRRILFVLVHYNQARETLPVVEHLAARGFEVTALFGWSGKTMIDLRSRVAAFGVGVRDAPPRYAYPDPWQERGGIDSAPEPPLEAKTPGNVTRIRRRVGLAVHSGRLWADAISEAREARRHGREALAWARPEAVFLGSFAPGLPTFEQAVASAARSAGILCCCLPYTPLLGERFAIKSRFDWRRISGFGEGWMVDENLTNRVVGRLFPDFWRERECERMFRYDPRRMLAARLAGLGTENNWQQPWQEFDVVYLESETPRDLLVESGYSPARLVVSGKPLLDAAIRRATDSAARAETYRELGLEPETPFVLFNLEPSAEHRYSDWDSHFARLRGTLDSLRATGLPVVVSLHPLCSPERYRFIGEEYGFPVPESLKIVDLYPLCGISVSFPCSTNAFAKLFDKPLVLYDFFSVDLGGTDDLRLLRIEPAARAESPEDVGRAVVRVAGEAMATTRLPPSEACAAIERDLLERLAGRSRGAAA